MDSLLKGRFLDFHQSGIPAYTRRDAAVVHVKDMVTTIVGGRKTGKTYLTYQAIDDLLRRGGIEPLRRVRYLHFDDDALAAMRQEDLAGIDRTFLSLLEKEEREGTLLSVDGAQALRRRRRRLTQPARANSAREPGSGRTWSK